MYDEDTSGNVGEPAVRVTGVILERRIGETISKLGSKEYPVMLDPAEQFSPDVIDPRNWAAYVYPGWKLIGYTWTQNL